MMRIGRALGKRADGGGHARCGGDIDAAADQGLDRFRAGLREQDFELEAVLLENAAALTEFGDSGVPRATLRDRDFENIFRQRVTGRAGDDRHGAERANEFRFRHFLIPPKVAPHRLTRKPAI